MSGPAILCEIADGLCTLTLNRPDKLNALDLTALKLLDAHLDTLDDSIGCIVLRGAGRSFCAGHDLGEISEGQGEDTKPIESGIVARLASLDYPVIAAVQGHCLTGGLELALAADIIVAAESARFADTHSRFDLVPVWGASQRLPRRIGRAMALEMLYTGRTVSGEEAARIGLANQCVPDADLDATAAGLAARILANAPRANRAIKRLVLETDGMNEAQGAAYELTHTAGRGPEFAERVARWKRR
ncbi:enoyl-CoA hydratase/isomerase family protein [Sphingomonas sp. AOB5]|uniref:enoyl-CoA hydratase/isomerase family protein n=1 Tax=Sphingomonas sp. AOB5 TaxID=3034017 RepID=UPI0023F92F0C|nr:enoyl-CoA hydratase/isomerase family protein [Sphingomonas sp. AOB5]MDF7776711.1 enoyl-CoA hydratase/isomerase family protein [Sphingomonas sp. AOB5]